ncbi:MAG: NAD(P) transhydrogenase subunit alpha [Acidobacteriales bacterium]|nr:NAD(P) transhydrogenase subunit alpha [Terriglobales bacterium]
MRIVVLREREPGETRVALMPDAVKKLVGAKAEVSVESGAGDGASVADADYTAAGARTSSDSASLLHSAEVLVCVNRPSPDVFAGLPRGSVVVGFMRPLDEPRQLEPAIGRGLTAFAMELIPRSTRAQSMDALSSMATIAGYKAALIGADRMPRMFPLLMTAAGTVPPARVLVLGAGVAGLQAIATARRLGAMVKGFDVRSAAGEQVKSLGASFIEPDLGGEQGEGTGGYARELTEEVMERLRNQIAQNAGAADVIITTAQVPGRPAPLLITENAVRNMRPGSVIIDLAAPTGGNCALCKPGQEINVARVTILAPLNLPATLPVHASQLYSNNVYAFLRLLMKDGELNIDMNDDVVSPTCVLHNGSVVNQRVASALGLVATRG